jgi:hypothetical protein
VFPERRGWFTDWLGESREWPEVPATFRSWPDYEDRASGIRTWTPGIIDGLVQSEGYAAAGGVYTEPHIVSALSVRFDSLRAESYRASESMAMIGKAGQLWTAGVNPATQMATAVSA